MRTPDYHCEEISHDEEAAPPAIPVPEICRKDVVLIFSAKSSRCSRHDWNFPRNPKIRARQDGDVYFG